MFLIHLKAKPTPEAKEYEDSCGAYVDIILKASSLEEAEALACSHIIERSWTVDKMITSVNLLPEHVSQMDGARLATFQKAMLQGITSSFTFWPKGETANDDSVKVSSTEPSNNQE